jgi:hypothetical protein
VLGRRKGLHVCTSPGRDTGDMGRARGHPHRTLQPLMTIAFAGWSLPGDVICVCAGVSVGWGCEGAHFVRGCMDVCVSIGGCRGLHVIVVGYGGGEQETCGARVALDSEQT